MNRTVGRTRLRWLVGHVRALVEAGWGARFPIPGGDRRPRRGVDRGDRRRTSPLGADHVLNTVRNSRASASRLDRPGSTHHATSDRELSYNCKHYWNAALAGRGHAPLPGLPPGRGSDRRAGGARPSRSPRGDGERVEHQRRARGPRGARDRVCRSFVLERVRPDPCRSAGRSFVSCTVISAMTSPRQRCWARSARGSAVR